MGMRINTNVAAIGAQKSIRKVNRSLDNNFAKLSTGQRIVRSADDAAGMAISEKMMGAIRSLKQADRNANDGISMVQIAEGGFNEVGNILNRLRELSIQAASDTVGPAEREYIDKEYQSLKVEIERIAQSTNFNGKKLMNGEGDIFEIQVGINNDGFQDRIVYNASQTDATLGALGIEDISALDKDSARDALGSIDNAINRLNSNRSELGAIQNRLVVTSNNIQTNVENTSAAYSRVRDLDYAEGASENAKLGIISQAATSVLAQANAQQGLALKLLG